MYNNSNVGRKENQSKIGLISLRLIIRDIMSKQTISCDVHDCHYCDLKSDMCQKEEIKVCHCSNEHEKEATMCDAYKKRKA